MGMAPEDAALGVINAPWLASKKAVEFAADKLTPDLPAMPKPPPAPPPAPDLTDDAVKRARLLAQQQPRAGLSSTFLTGPLGAAPSGSLLG